MMPHVVSPALSPADAPPAAPLSPRDDAAILRLWRELNDTLEIARRLNRPQAQIANRLAQLRDEAGTAMTPTQYALHHARKQRRARFQAAAARIAPQPQEPPPRAGANTPRRERAAIDPFAERSADVEPHSIAVPVLAWDTLGLPSEALSSGDASNARCVAVSNMVALASRVGNGAPGNDLDCPAVREIQRAVCAHYQVTLRELISPRRHASIVRPRQVAIYLCKQLTMLTMPKIGDLFGGRDHTTILVSNRKIAMLMTRDKNLAATIAMLTTQLTAPQGAR